MWNTEYRLAAILFALVLTGAPTASSQDRMTVNSTNVHIALKQMEEMAKPGQKIGNVTLTGAKADGKTFTSFYIYDDGQGVLRKEEVNDEFIDGNYRELCGHDDLKILMKYGAIIERVIFNTDEETIIHVSASKSVCSKKGY